MPPMPVNRTIYGTATLNEKGQLVIPAEARTALNLQPGSRLMIMNAPFGEALVIVKTEEIERQIQSYTAALVQPQIDNPKTQS